MAVPRSRHVVSQSATFFANGNRVGSAQNVSPTESLSNAIVRELDADVAGEIIEIAIGVPSYSLAVSMFKVYQQSFYKALGYVVQNIGDIVDPVDLQTTFKSALTGNTLVKTFVDSTIESMSEPVNISTILIAQSANFKVRTII